MRVKVLELPQIQADDVSRSFADEIGALEGVEGVQSYPDSFTKSKYLGLDYKITTPSSSTIVTKADHLYPQFRSRGIGCGMRAVALPISHEDLDIKLVEGVYGKLQL